MTSVSETVRRPAEEGDVLDVLTRARREPAALIVEGEAGIGKTTLVLGAAERAREMGFAVLMAHGSPAEVGYAYAAVADLVASVDDAVIAALPERQRLALERVRGDATEGPSTDERITATAFCSVIGSLTERSPVLLTIDDAQWLDPSSRAVIGFAARRMTDATALLVTRRTDDPDTAAAVSWPTFPNPDTATRVHMRPLDADGVHALISTRLHRALPRPVVTRIHETSAGNPMFALELARGELDGLTSADDLPTGLATLVRRRVGHLDARTRAVLLAAACAAAPTVEMISSSLDLSVLEVVDLIETLEARSVVSLAGNRVLFGHPLYATGVVAEATPAQCRATHKALAEVVDHPELRARHLALASSTADAATLSALEAAAESLASRGATAAAAELVDLMLDRGGDTAMRRVRAAELRFRSGSVAAARRHVQIALDGLPAGVSRALALAHLGAIKAYDDDLTGAIEMLSEAAAHAEEAPTLRVMCLIRLSLAVAIADRMAEAVEHARHAIVLAREFDLPGLQSQALSLYVTATFIEGRGFDAAALRSALELEDPHSGATTFLRARAVEAVMSAYLGDLETADAQLRAVKRSMTTDGNEIDLVWIDNRIAAAAIWSGRYTEAREAARAGVQRAEQLGATLSLVTALTKRAAVAAYQGHVAAARADARAAIEAARSIGARRQIKEPTRVLTFLEVSRGDYRAALAAVRPLLDEFDPPRELEIEGGEHLPDAIEALTALGHLEKAETLVGALQKYGADRDRPWMMAVGARGLGAVLAARGDLAAAHNALDEAMIHHERLAMPFERARTQLLLGQLQRRRRQRRPAADTLTVAVNSFESLGTGLWAARARAELTRLSSVPRTGHPLTAAERRTADLAVEGLSNRDIATASFLSEKTVEATLSAVYRKLGIRSRAGLAVALRAADAGTD
ncbi:AAA family ATPase [Mycolicibacterium sp. 018/SC-01/001]|uniref:AAA family ATPase n=1 Tax=Mycolicibacterium sp. 018/SC-01/001 TaxID=2592069 RepID=UPI00117D5320|nr:LuxR family transcriptional regulator [Mycolicibacterium sp. 018/SC-01/001]TRW80307.1 AAA family ATPase [Mycolicibacterium sp. 018/SC-01/001]